MKDHKSSKYCIGEPANYDGPDRGTCIQSYQTLIRDMALQAGINIPPKSQHVIDKAITQFVDAFHKTLTTFKSGSQVKDFADLCKQRKNELLSVANFLAINDYPKIANCLYFETGSNNQIVNLSDLNYFPNSLKSVFVWLKDEGLLLDHVAIKYQPRFYIYLYKLLFEIVKVVFSNSSNDQDPDAVVQLYLIPVSIGQLFERLNPTSDVMEEYAEDLLSVLQTPGRDPSEEFLQLFEEVKNDILSPRCKLKYVSEFRKALKHFKYRKFKTSDYYATLKASTSTIEIGGRSRRFPSIVSSLFESDELRGSLEIQRFDELIGYNSAYLSKDEQEEHNLIVSTNRVETKEIPNPSKYKPRGIHIGSNSLQDRCNWFHNQLQPFLISLPNDSMVLHQKGVDFLVEITSPKYRDENQNSIFVSDFSNATDTLNQQFQCLCLELLFPQEVVDFWRYVSQLPKEFYMPNSRIYKHYIQETGQPQGLLGSFDAFSLAHHILMLMLMKCSGLEDYDPLKFYRILGDDSVVSFPTVDSNHDLYQNHSWLCKECSLIKNDSKTAKSFYNNSTLDYPDEVLDFAKVSVSRGRFLTPLPVGLGAFYSEDPAVTKLSAILWYNYHKVTFKKLLHHVVFQCYGKNMKDFLIAESILTSGQIPYLASFKDEEISRIIDSTIQGVSIYSYGISELQNTFLGYFISEENKQAKMFTRLSFEQIWNGFFPRSEMDEWSRWVSKDHKFWKLLEDSVELSEDIQTLYELGDPTLAIAIGGLFRKDGLEESIHHTIHWINSVKELQGSEDLWQMFSHLSYEALFHSLTKEVGQYQVKSFSKASKDYSKFLYNAIKQARKSSYYSLDLTQEIKSCQVELLTYIIDHVYPTGNTVS